MDEVEIRRSTRRRKTIAVRREGDRTIAMVPAHMSQRDVDAAVARLVERLDRRRARQASMGDDELMARARGLSERWLDGAAQPLSVRWVSNQNSRWGSCSPDEGSIRLSDRLVGFPDHVVDYVLVHELVHLLELNHTPRFWELVGRYPLTERARGFLEGVAHQRPAPS